jgi:homoserine kinase
MKETMKEVTVYAPATVANVVCGFDILGFALGEPHDKMVVRISDKKGVKRTEVSVGELACVDVKSRTAVHLEAVQTPDTTERKGKSMVVHYVDYC